MNKPLAILTGLIIVISFLTINIFLLNDYSLTWDTFIHFSETEKTINFIRFGEGEITKLPYGLIPTIFSHISYVFFYGKLGILAYDAAHLLPLIFYGAIGVAVIYFFTLETLGFIPAISASLFLSVYPHYLVSSHTNVKDLPLAVTYAAAIWLFWRAIKHKTKKHFLLAGIALGISLATKINAFLLPLIFFLWLACFYFKKIKWKQKKINDIYFLNLLLFSFIALITMYLLWPYLWPSPIDRLISMFDFFSNIKSHQILYFGKIYQVIHDRPWHYPLGYLSIVTPLPILIFVIIGLIRSLRQAIFRRHATHGLILLWFLIPTIKYIHLEIEVFDNIRHFLEVIFPLMIFAGIGVKVCLELSKRKIVRILTYLLASASFIWVVIQNIHYHPYQNAYYNVLVGGAAGAKNNFDLDYWGFSLKEGSGWLNHHALPETSITVPLAPQVARFYLRHDLQVIDKKLTTSDYVMVFDKPSDFTDQLREYLKTHQPVHTIKRDNVVLLSIYQNNN